MTLPVGVEWYEGARHRRIVVGDASHPLFGLPELMDNNPLVCADEACVPNPEQTLTLIALGPLADAGLLKASPILTFAFEADEQSVWAVAERLGLDEPPTVNSVEVDWAESTVLLTAFIELDPAVSAEDVDGLFDERYSRSLYVRRCREDEFDVPTVLNRPFAIFHTKFFGDAVQQVLVFRVIADRNGKCGTSQVRHVQNIMCGREECDGID